MTIHPIIQCLNTIGWTHSREPNPAIAFPQSLCGPRFLQTKGADPKARPRLHDSINLSLVRHAAPAEAVGAEVAEQGRSQ